MAKTEDSMETARGREVELTVGDKKVKVVPFTLGDYIALRRYVRSEKIGSFLDSAGTLSSEERTKVLLELSSQPIGEFELQMESQTPEGMTFMLWHSLKRANGELDIEELRAAIDEETLENMIAVTQGVNTEEPTNENPPEAETV